MSKTQGKVTGDKGAVEPPAAPAREGSADVLGGGNLDQVREILFGAQSRNTDKRLARLEEELPKRVAEIREELKRGLANLETYARQEIDSLNERARAESKERGAHGTPVGLWVGTVLDVAHEAIEGVSHRALLSGHSLGPNSAHSVWPQGA